MAITREAVRNEDMSARGHLRLLQQDDGDIIVVVHTQENDLVMPGVSVEFCSPMGGGGRSPRTLAALHALMDAIDADNRERPIHK